MNNEEFDSLYCRLDEYVKNNVSEHRYQHTIGVVNAAEKFAIKYGCDVNKAKIAAIFHDACKSSVGGLEHGAAAAKLLKSEFKVDDPDILAAIEYHTIGRKNCTLLEKVIKLADLLEEGREYDDVPFIRDYEKSCNDIDNVYLLLLFRQKKALISQHVDYDKRLDELIDYYIEVLKHDK